MLHVVAVDVGFLLGQLPLAHLLKVEQRVIERLSQSSLPATGDTVNVRANMLKHLSVEHS
ncbi:hypothetical protein AB4143_12660 [Vibrio breoganii]